LISWDREKFRRMFPNLYREIESAKVPDVLDHLERCESEEEAIEIIEYFEKKGEITREFAAFLKSNRALLKSLIGTRKPGEYERWGLR